MRPADRGAVIDDRPDDVAGQASQNSAQPSPSVIKPNTAMKR